MANVGDLHEVLGDDPVDDSIGPCGGEQAAVAAKCVEHRRADLGKIAERLELRENAVLKRNRKSGELSCGSRQKLNPYGHGEAWTAVP